MVNLPRRNPGRKELIIWESYLQFKTRCVIPIKKEEERNPIKIKQRVFVG